jgi:hypothetical protein
MTVPSQPKLPVAMMIDALTWHRNAGMRKLVVKYLDPDEAFRIEAELNFDRWPDRELAVALEDQIRAHGLVQQAVAGMRALQAGAPDLDELETALGVKKPGQNGSTAPAVPNAVRGEVIRFSAVFGERRPRFQYVSAYKDLHDHLHTLQRMEDGIRQAAERFHVHPDQPDEMVGVAKAVIALAKKARRSFKVLKEPRRVGQWLGEFGRGAGLLLAAAMRHDPVQVAEQVEGLSRLPGQRLSDVNNELLDSIDGLKPDELAVRVGDILTKLTPTGSAAPGFVDHLRLTLGQFREQCAELHRLMNDHDACQEFETVVALAAATRGAIPPVQIYGWAKARDGLATVTLEPGDGRGRNVIEAAKAYETAAGTQPVAAEELNKLLESFRPLFTEIDKRLLGLTDRLVQSAAYLNVQLGNFANVNHQE